MSRRNARWIFSIFHSNKDSYMKLMSHIHYSKSKYMIPYRFYFVLIAIAIATSIADEWAEGTNGKMFSIYWINGCRWLYMQTMIEAHHKCITVVTTFILLYSDCYCSCNINRRQKSQRNERERWMFAIFLFLYIHTVRSETNRSKIIHFARSEIFK